MFPPNILIRGGVVFQNTVEGRHGPTRVGTHHTWLAGSIVSAVMILVSSLALVASPLEEPAPTGRYSSNAFCTACHTKIADQHSKSYHSQSFSDPLFKGQYFKELLPLAEKEPMMYEEEARECLHCHSPIDYIRQKDKLLSRDQTNSERSGVQCAFCHSITGYIGDTPGNGKFISKPDLRRVLGPLSEKDDWHHVYSELHTRSEFCGICHNGYNRYGLQIKSTFTEWENSIFADNEIQCQDCHMNAMGFLLDWRPVYESGPAVDPSETFVRARNRSRLYTHRFPGSHSETQIVETGDIALYIETERPVASPGDEIRITVYVDNSGTGHKMPSGSAELRHLWLELVAYNGKERIPVPAIALGTDGYDVKGNGSIDQEILGEDIPAGTRIYRTILVDTTDRQTLSSYDAVKVLFDNRLNAAELRAETYYLKVPEYAGDHLTLKANLNYLPYPSSFSRRFGLPKPDSWKITSASKTLLIK